MFIITHDEKLLACKTGHRPAEAMDSTATSAYDAGMNDMPNSSPTAATPSAAELETILAAARAGRPEAAAEYYAIAALSVPDIPEAVRHARTEYRHGRFASARTILTRILAHEAVASNPVSMAEARWLAALIDARQKPNAYGVVGIGTVEEERVRFAQTVARLTEAGQPVKLHYGPGFALLEDFLNIDRHVFPNLVPDGWLPRCLDRFFVLPSATRLPIPDNSVDYVFHEDFFEHLDQRDQIVLLAEMRRVLKPGAVHRINTPCLKDAMRRWSRMDEGASGIHTSEWDRWDHVSLVTRTSLDELAAITGYSHVVYNQKGQSISPHRGRETRPGDDRDPIVGNIFADLIK